MLAILAGLILAGQVERHPSLLLFAIPLTLGAIAWLLGSSVLGAARLLRYGGRRARAERRRIPPRWPR